MLDFVFLDLCCIWVVLDLYCIGLGSLDLCCIGFCCFVLVLGWVVLDLCYIGLCWVVFGFVVCEVVLCWVGFVSLCFLALFLYCSCCERIARKYS